MSVFDWYLISILVYSTIKAFLRGIILELFSLGGMIAGILLAGWSYNRAAIVVERVVATRAVAQVISFFLVIFLVALLSGQIGKALNRTAHAIGLALFDRLLGALFGFARGCLVGVAILMAFAAFFPHSAWLKNSHLSPYFLAGAHAVSFVVPDDLQQQILSGAAQLKHNAPDWINLLP